MSFGTTSYPGVSPLDAISPIKWTPGRSQEDAETTIRAVYRQVLGNAYVMESERLTVPESQFKRGELSVREFVRVVAKSDLYRSRFFTSCARYRAIELNYKHLLGRAPDSFEEMRYHSTMLDQFGFEADIDTYLDGDEYQTAFGEFVVPYYRGLRTQPGQSMLEFTNMLQLLRSFSGSDKDLTGGNQPTLTRSLILNSPYGKLKSSNVSEILAEVFKPKQSVITQPQSWAATYAADAALQKKIQEQTQVIDCLQKQLKDLSPFAAIGATQVGDAWQTTVVSMMSTSSQTTIFLQQQIDAQATQISTLESQIAEARRYAAIGESRLNRWRSRVFNG